jgi:two-component system, OmpR family, sensor histidine kinase ChvG
MKRLPAFLSRISVRLLAFNLLVLFIPVVGFLSLGTYERQLLRSQERSLVQQARVLAAGLEGSSRPAGDAVRILSALRRRSEARLRVLDAEGRLLADSARLPYGEEPGAARTQAAAQDRPAEETFLYRLASAPVRVWRRYLRPPRPPLESDDYYAGQAVLAGPEVRDALAGGYGAATRVSGHGIRSITLYSAIPIMGAGTPAVTGAVLASQSTYRILVDLYALRLDVFVLFLWSLAAALALSLLAAATVTVPVRRLGLQARSVLDARGRLAGRFVPSRRRDEVGELSRALGRLSDDLARRVGVLESFASDVAHELRNPLASVRSAAELALGSADPSEREALLSSVIREAGRMEMLLAGVREVSLLDAGAPEEEMVVGARETAARVLDAFRLREDRGIRYVLDGPEIQVLMAPGRLAQVVENLVDNAAGFSPPGGQVRVELAISRGGDGRQEALIAVADEGPGIPPDIRDRIFDRFFSWRPGQDRGAHPGLGLAIVKSIVEAVGGMVRAAPGQGRGARLEVLLPAARTG